MDNDSWAFSPTDKEVADALDLLSDQLRNGEASMASVVETAVDDDHYQVHISFLIKRNDPEDQFPEVQIMYPV